MTKLRIASFFSPVGYLAVVIIILLSGAGYMTYLYRRPIPLLTATATIPASTKTDKPAAIPWPAVGQSSIGITGRGILASSSDAANQKAYPTASVAKLMTALAVLDKKPMATGETGPMITISKADVDIYNSYVAQGGSVAAVQEGEQISEYDALEALLLPSANNLADSMSIWAFGSVKAYCDYANAYAKDHGMAHSTFSDASGFSPDTTSTANDLVTLGLLAHNNPVIAEIAAKKAADIPVAGTVYNVNGLLGRNGINGLKTGNTDQAGGVFVASADRQVDGHQVTIVTAVIHGPDLDTAMKSNIPLLDATAANLEQKTITKAGQSFGTYTIPWQKDSNGRPIQVKAIATKDVTAFIWKGDSIKTQVSLAPLTAPQAKGTAAGTSTITVNDKKYPASLTLQDAIAKPGLMWRLNR
jgi:serine-type D-Ala-D-Ala carboxypeptidase (penicillin-binding protein 5/6)